MKSIRARLTLALITAGALLLAALGFAVHARARALLTAQFDDGLRARAAALVSLLHWSPDGSAKLDYKGEFMPEFEHRRGGFFFEVRMEKTGDLIERSHSLSKDFLPPLKSDGGFIDFTLGNGKPARAFGIRAARVIETEEIESAEPRNKQTSDGAGARISVAGTTSAIAQQLRQLALELVGECCVGILLIAFIVRRVLASGLGKLVEFSTLAARLDASNLTERFPTKGVPAELAPIASRLNDLLARLDAAFTRERRFSADVAHELRTPIAELRTLADVGCTAPDNTAEAAAFYHDARDIAGKMEATVSALIFISRCESGTQPVDQTPVDITALLADLRAEYAPRARELALGHADSETVILQTDAALFTRLLRILLDNAVQYTRPGGVITLTLSVNQLCITNGPTNLAPADAPRLGERFWRKDPARSDSAHSGLGLALAVEIARILQIRLTTRVSESSALTVSLAWKR